MGRPLKLCGIICLSRAICLAAASVEPKLHPKRSKSLHEQGKVMLSPSIIALKYPAEDSANNGLSPVGGFVSVDAYIAEGGIMLLSNLK